MIFLAFQPGGFHAHPFYLLFIGTQHGELEFPHNHCLSDSGDLPCDLHDETANGFGWHLGCPAREDPPEVVEFAGISGFELQRITIKVRRPGGGKLVVVFYRTGLAL